MTARASLAAQRGPISRAVNFAQRQPERLLLAILGVHLLVWMLLPIAICANLQLDLVEALALGKEWQLGYWKHPPLPWWLADLAYRASGSVHAVYVLGPLAAVTCMYAVWRLAREITGPIPALISVLALEGLHFFNFSVVKFAHDQMQLPFWALTGLFFYRALTREKVRDWALAGAFLAVAFWSKYAAFALAATLGLFLLADPHARRAWRTPGPYVMAAAFLLVLAPHLAWLVEAGFLPFRYVDARAASATQWHQYLTFPLRWSGAQLLFLAPVLALLAVLFWRGGPRVEPVRPADFARRYITALALGPFLITTVIAMLLGRLPIAMWGYPLWCFAPLAIVLWHNQDIAPARLSAFARLWALVFAGYAVAYTAVELFEPLVRDRAKATQFPGRLLASTVTETWRKSTGTPLAYVGGAQVGTAPGEFAANNVAVYSADRPRVVVHGESRLSPWVDPGDLARRGIVLVWEQSSGEPALPENLRRNFPAAELQAVLSLPRQALRAGKPALIGFALVRPQP